VETGGWIPLLQSGGNITTKSSASAEISDRVELQWIHRTQ